VGKSDVLEHISGLKIDEKLLWRAYRNSPILFRMVPSPTPRPMAASSPRLGVHNPHPKLQSLSSQERLKLQTSNLADRFTGPSEQKHVKNFGEKGAWAYPGTAQFLPRDALVHSAVMLQ